MDFSEKIYARKISKHILFLVHFPLVLSFTKQLGISLLQERVNLVLTDNSSEKNPSPVTAKDYMN